MALIIDASWRRSDTPGEQGTQNGSPVAQGAQPSQAIGARAQNAFAVRAVAYKRGVAVAAVDLSPTAVVSTQVFQTVIPFTTVDANSQTIVGSSTVLSTALVTTTPGVTDGSTQQQGSNDDGARKNTTAIIVGASVGGAVLLIIVAGCMFFVLRRNRRRREMKEATLAHPFTAQRGNSGGGSISRDIESQRGPNAMISQRRGPVVSAPSPRIRQTPTVTPPQNPFVDPEEYDQVSLSPDGNGPEKLHIKTASTAAQNPFADPVKTPAERNTPANRGYNRGVEKLRGEVNRSASTRSTTNTPKVAGLPSRPSSAANTPRSSNFGNTF